MPLMQAPAGTPTGATVIFPDGTQASVNSAGQVNVANGYIGALVNAGYVTVVALPAKFTLNTGAGPLTAAAGDMTGPSDVTVQYSGVNGQALTTRTAAQLIADAGFIALPSSYNLRVISSTALGLTLVAGVGVTIVGKQVIPGGGYQDYIVTLVNATTVTMQSAGSGPTI